MIYKKVNTADRLPDEDGVYTTDIGELPFKNGKFLWGISDGRLYEIERLEYWLEPIDLPDKNYITKYAERRFSNFRKKIGFIIGVKWILEKLK